MTDENRKMFEKLKATGVFSEEELERLRAGFEKPPRKYDKKKSDLHMTTVGLVENIEDKVNEVYCGRITMTTSWQPEDHYGDGNAYIFIDVTRNEDAPALSVAGNIKKMMTKALKNADKVDVNWEKNTIYIKLTFTDVIKEGDKE